MALTTGACATADPVHLGDGASGYFVRCDWDVSGSDLCYQKAGELCGPVGYRLVDWDGQPQPADVRNMADRELAGFGSKRMLVTCGRR